jgi:hypothetical protein
VSKVVIAYASNFWKPGESPKDGIGLVAKSNYDGIVKAFPNDEIIYLDASEYSKIREIKDVSALFSISASIDKYRKICKPSLTTLISVNESALLRRTIKDRAKHSNRNHKFLDGHDGIYSNLKEFKDVDFILGFGSWNLFKSYSLTGVDESKVFPIGWEYWNTFEEQPKNEFGKKIVAYLGAICFRKGIDKVIELVIFLNKNFPEYKLELSGFAWNPNWRDELNDLALRFPTNFVWNNQRINYGQKNWLDLKNESCFAIFPSFEEGLSGCAMDVVNLGIPLFHSDRTGLESSHESVFNLNFEDVDWLDRLSNVILGGPTLWSSVAAEQRKAAFHQSSSNRSLERAIQRISEGFLWPRVEISPDIYSDLKTKDKNFIEKISGRGIPDYSIYSEKANFNSQVNVQYSDVRPINKIESIQMAIFLAEKYNSFSSLSFMKKNGAALDLFVSNHLRQSFEPKAINLFMRAYSNRYLANKQSIHFLMARECIYNPIERFRYKLKRYLNIILLKLKLVISSYSKQNQK